MRLLIAIPCMDSIPTEFVRSLLKLQKRLIEDGVNFDFCVASGTLIYMARNKIVNKAIEENYDSVLWLDSDMVFDENIYDDLASWKKDFVTGIYHMRRPQFYSCIFKSIELETFATWGDDYPTDLFEIAGCGFGCCLTSVQLLRDIKDKFEKPFDPIKNYGEDIAFCKRAHELGYKIYCDPFVRCGHIAHITLYPDDAPRFRDKLLEG